MRVQLYMCDVYRLTLLRKIFFSVYITSLVHFGLHHSSDQSNLSSA